jgi:hypothetical protein
MSAPPLPEIRQWAVLQGLPGAGRRGPVSYDVQVAYAEQFGLPAPDRVERPLRNSPRPTASPARPFRGSSCRCGRRWEGAVECHCSRCHKHFRSETSFDGHLRLIPGTERAECVDPLAIYYRSGAKKGEPKYREVAVHHGLLIVRAEDRPDQLEIETRTGR